MSALYKVKEQPGAIASLVKGKKLSANAVAVFCWLGDNVEDGNKASIDTKDIVAQFSIDKAAVSRVIKELEEGLLIKVEHKEGSERVIAVHPWYWWKGRYELQAGAVKRWIADIRKKHWGSVVKETEVFLNE